MTVEVGTRTLADLDAVALEGSIIRLEPLERDHAGEFFAAGSATEIWRYQDEGPVESPDDALARIEAAQSADIPFAVRNCRSGAFVGSVRYRDVQPHNETVEIAGLWLSREQRGTLAAAEVVSLLAAHVFDDCGAGRVWVQVDARDKASNTSLKRFGFSFEICLRRNRRVFDGFIRDSNIYSVTADEWPHVKAEFDHLLAVAQTTFRDWRTVKSTIFADPTPTGGNR